MNVELSTAAPARRLMCGAPKARAPAPSTHPVLRLQSMAGNQAVTQLLSIQRTPTDTDFDPDLVVNDLSLAIRHDSEIHGDQGTKYFVTVDGRAAAAALTDLTVAQGKAVEARWEVRDKHNLRKLLNGGYKSVRLSSGSIERLIGLLSGTKAEVVTDPWGETDRQTQERREVEKRALELDVGELYAAFREKRGANSDVILPILRRRAGSPENIAVLEAHYKETYKATVKEDIEKYMPGQAAYADAVYRGDAMAVATFDIETVPIFAGSGSREPFAIGSDLIGQMERLRLADGGQGAVLREILSRPTHHGGTISGTIGEYLRNELGSPIVDAFISGDHTAVAAAKLAFAKKHNNLTAKMLEEAIVSVGGVGREMSTAEGDYEKEQELDAVFGNFARNFFEMTGNPQSKYVPEFRAFVNTVGSAVERERNLTLLTGRGAYTADEFATSGMGAKPLSAEIKELELAIRQESAAHVKTILADKTEAEIRALEAEYKLQVGKDLSTDMTIVTVFGKGSQDERNEVAELYAGGGRFQADPKKDDRANLVEEGLWLHARIERIHERAMSQRGAYAHLRDWWGNQEAYLVGHSKKDADEAYGGLLTDANNKDMAAVRARVLKMRRAYIRLKRSIAIHDEATQRSFSEFVDTAVGLVTLAASLVGGPSGMLLRVIIAKVGTKLVLLGSDYSAKQFVEDVASEVTSVAAGQAAVGLLGKGIGGLSAAARRTKLKLNPEITALAGKGARWAVDQIGSSLGSQFPGVVLGGKDLHAPGVQDFVTALGVTGLHTGKAWITSGKRSSMPTPKRRDADPETVKADKEIAKLGKLDMAGDTREFLRINNALRLNLIKHPLANRVFKHCASLCYPEELKRRPDLIEKVEETLGKLKSFDDGLVNHYLYERRGNIEAAVTHLEGLVEGTRGGRNFDDTMRRVNQGEPPEIASLASGIGVRQPPHSRAALSASNQAVVDARNTLMDPNARPAEQVSAVRALIARAVADFRALRQVELMQQRKSPLLTGENLCLRCMPGRDITSDAVASMVAHLKVPVTIERYQAAAFVPGSRHAFAVIRTVAGDAFLVDPTFGQFADRMRRPGQYTAGPMVSTPEGQRLAANLLADGFIQLNPTNAQLYLRGLGASAPDAVNLAAGLSAGKANKAFLIDVVGGGEVKRTVTNWDDAAHLVQPKGKEGMIPYIDELIKPPRNDVLAQMLRDLRRKFEELPNPGVQ